MENWEIKFLKDTNSKEWLNHENLKLWIVRVITSFEIDRVKFGLTQAAKSDK